MMRRGRWVGWGVSALVFALVAVAVVSTVVMALWNWLMPALFGLGLITFWQAVGLLVFSRILFGRFGRFGGGWRGHWRGRWHGGWRARMAERWSQMTPEQREQFRAGMRGCCGDFEARSPEPTA